MKINGYFVIQGTKSYYGSYKGSLRFVKSKPALTSKEIALQAEIDIPDVFFERLIPAIKISVPADAAIQPSTETVVQLTSIAAGEALNIEVKKVEDALTQLVEEKNSERETAVQD